MASGETLFIFTPQGRVGPTTAGATFDTFAAAAGVRSVLDFIGSGGAADEIAHFPAAWPSNYAGGGVDVKVHYSTDGTSVGAVQWEVSFEVLQDADDQDAGGQDFGTATDITDTPSTATANILDVTAAGVISHVNCGSPSAGNACRFRIARDFDHATNTDDAQLQRVVISES